MLLVIVIVLVILWALGFTFAIGWWIHLLLVAAVILGLIRFIQWALGRR